MTISKDRRELYPSMSDNEIGAADEIYGYVVNVLTERGIKMKGDDRAENLVGAIARFIEDSKRD